MTERTTGNRAELNGHFAAEIERATDLEWAGDRLATGDCPLPGCADPRENFFFHRNYRGEESFACYGCGRQGGAVEFEMLMNGHQLEEFRLTDLGNAERLAARHGNDLRFCHLWGKWLVWDGKRWKIDAAGEVTRRAVETVRSIYAEAEHGDDRDERKRIARHATASESRTRIEAMIALARSLPGVQVEPEQLDADPWLLNADNGTIDLRTGQLRSHRREDLITKLASVEYRPDAEAPTWAAFLERILPSEALRRFVQRAIGYAAAGVVSEEILVILYGLGANGKSTLVNVVMDALEDYAMQAAPDLLLAKRGSHPTELADLFGARFVASVEVDEGRRLAESLVKQLTGRDPIKARRMREDFWQFDPTHTVFFATNHRPEVRGTDHAIWRRIKLVPFEVTIPEEEQDKQLPAKLRDELPGVLAWIVRGCSEYQREGLGAPEEVAAATKSYREQMDVLAAFIAECCVVRDGVWSKFKDLYTAYVEWCSESGEGAESKKKFGMRLTERGYRADNGTNNVAIRWGIALRQDGDPDPSRINDQGPDQDRDQPKNPPAADEAVNSGNEGLTIENPEKPRKSGGYDERVNDNYPRSDMSEGISPRKGLTRNHVNDRSFVNSDEQKLAPAQQLVRLLAAPPPWLARQLERCRVNRGQFLDPTASAIAAEVYGTATRAEEVKPVLDAHLGDGA